jgi:hypothetical protein
MNSANTPSNSNLLNRLILLVLCLNLVCLILLLAKAYRQPGAPAVQSAPVEQEDTSRPVATRLEPTPRPVTKPVQVPTATRSADGMVRTPPSAIEREREDSPAVQAAPVTVIPAPLVPPGTLVNVPSQADAGGRPATAPSGTARLDGRVILKGTPPPEIPINIGPQCAQAVGRVVTTRHYVVGPDNGLADVVVWLKNATPAPAIQPSPLLETVGCMFEPYVMGVVTGQKFTWRNSDPIMHNMHATPKNNREFNFAQPARGTIKSLSFGTAEFFIRIKCDVHPWELAYVNVFEHPYFSITDTNGAFAIPPGFPPGRYVVGARHLKTMGITGADLEQEVELRDGESRHLTFEVFPAKVQAKGR